MGLFDRPRVKGLADRVLGAAPSPGGKLIVPTHVPIPTLDNRELMELFKKDLGASPASGMFGGGWQGAMSSRYRTGAARISALLNAYGGTMDSVSWVFSCVSLIGSTMGSYPWRFENGAGETVEIEDAPADLRSLLERPNPDWTWFDMAEAVATDLEMVGNGYLLKNEMNGLGQPKTIYRLRPDRVRIVVAADGTEVGYVYTTGDNRSLPIPYEFDEVIHFRYPNPLDDHYGMGTVEAISQVLDMHSAQTLHITGYFQNGARISGVLTVAETMTDTQFERLKDSWRENYAGPANAYKMLIAEGASGYTPISQTPIASGVVELAKMTKDEILSGFGIPAPLLGGLMENANYKMEESQHIFLRAMIPKARRIAERFEIDLISRWGLDFKIDAHANEPMEVRIAHAKEMLGAGATLNQALEAMGLPPSDDPKADVPLIPNNLIPLDVAGLPPRPAASMPLGQNPEAGGPRPGQELVPNDGTHPALPAGPGGELAQHLQDLAQHLNGGAAAEPAPAKRLAELEAELTALRKRFEEQHPEAVKAAEVAEEVAPTIAAAERALRELEGISTRTVTTTQTTPTPLQHVGGSIVVTEPPAIAKRRPRSRDALSAVTDAADLWGAKGRRRGSHPRKQAEQQPGSPIWTPPIYPKGYEQLDDRELGPEAAAIRKHQAEVLTVAYENAEPFLKTYFREQRDRVLGALSLYGTSAAHRRAGKAKSDISTDAIFNVASENQLLVPAWKAMLDVIGEKTLPMPMNLGAGLSWDVTNPRIAELKDRLGVRITNINETTRQAINDVIDEGMRRGYSIPQLANGYPDEKFRGIMGVFDDASGYRAEMIARTESAFAYNWAQTLDYTEAGVQYVQILDGLGDYECAEADGQTWTTDDYAMDPIAHPNCIRTAIPVDATPADVSGDMGE